MSPPGGASSFSSPSSSPSPSATRPRCNGSLTREGTVMLPRGEGGGGWEAGRPPGAQCGIKELIHAEPLRRCPARRCNNDGNNSHLNNTQHVPHTLGGCAHRGWFTPKNNPTTGYRVISALQGVKLRAEIRVLAPSLTAGERGHRELNPGSWLLSNMF